MSMETTTTDDGVTVTFRAGTSLDDFVEGMRAMSGSTIHAPAPDQFIGPDGEPCEFLVREDLTDLGQRVIGQYEQFAHLLSLEVLFLWKAQGGASNGRDTLGKAQRPTGLLRHFSDAQFIIWLAADHIQKRFLSSRQIEAIIFHELCHCSVDEEKGTPKIIGHDLSAFISEVAHYGLWSDDWRRAERQIKQLSLPGVNDR